MQTACPLCHLGSAGMRTGVSRHVPRSLCVLSAQGGDLVRAWMVVLGSCVGMSAHLPVSPVSLLEFRICNPCCLLVSGLISRPFGLENQAPTLKGSPFGVRAGEGDEGLSALASSAISVSLSGSSWSP